MGNPINVESKIQIYELNGIELMGLESDNKPFIIRNHWNRRAFVVLKYNDMEIVVIADQLKTAIDNAQNAHRF